jgi:hypothetical protein
MHTNKTRLGVTACKYQCEVHLEFWDEKKYEFYFTPLFQNLNILIL